MFDERKPAVEAIFNRFCKPGKEGWINQVLEDTAGMLTGNFLKGCEAVKDLEEMPHNIAKEIRRLGHADQKKEYYYCSFCWGLGLIYHHEMIGAYYMQWVERCSCKSGEKYAWMDKEKNMPEWVRQKRQGKSPEPTRSGPVPMPMDNF